VKSVSIPYRYAGNPVGPGLADQFPDRFQFLIGTLETKKERGDIMLGGSWFQFLIGTLGTVNWARPEGDGGGFNSL